jgi:hypothetical protein
VLTQRECEAEIASATAVVPALYAPASSVQTTKSCERQFNECLRDRCRRLKWRAEIYCRRVCMIGYAY